MASAIDPTKPVTGNPTTQSVRDNFAAAAAEISALQTAVASATGDITSVVAGTGLLGGGASGDVTLSLDPSAIPSSNGTVTNIATGPGLSGGPITTTGMISLANMAPNTLRGNNIGSAAPPTDLSVAQVMTMLGALPLTGGTLSGPGNLTVSGSLQANSAVTVTGNLQANASATVTGNLQVNASATLNGAVTAGSGLTVRTGGILAGAAGSVPAAGAMVLNSNTVAPPTGLSPNLYVVGADGAVGMVAIDSFGTGLGGLFRGRKARGTAAAPAPVQINDTLSGLEGYGFAAAGTYGSTGAYLVAMETFSASAQGTSFDVWTNPTGTTSGVRSLRLQGNVATFSGDVHLNGNLFAPNYSNFGNTAGGTVGATLIVGKANPASPTNWWDMTTVELQDTRALAAGTGAGINLGGTVNNSGGMAGYGGIYARKSTATANDALGDLVLRARGGSIFMYNQDPVNAPILGQLNATGVFTSASGYTCRAGTSGGTSNVFNIYWTGSSAHLWIDNADNGSINLTPCDERLKTNLKAPTVDALGAINAIALKQFDWLKNDLRPKRHEDIGFTAQQLAEVIPNAVDLHEDIPDQMASVQLTPIVAHLIGAVQQITQRLEAVEKRKPK